MIDYDNPKHIKVLFAILIITSIPLGILGLNLSYNAIVDGYIYISNRNFSGNIYFDKTPYKYLFFVCFIGIGGAIGLWAGIHLLVTFKSLGKRK